MKRTLVLLCCIGIAHAIILIGLAELRTTPPTNAPDEVETPPLVPDDIEITRAPDLAEELDAPPPVVEAEAVAPPPEIEATTPALPNPVAKPTWAADPYRAFPEDRGKRIFGLGEAEKNSVPSTYLRKKAADNRAKEAVAMQLRAFVQAVFKDYHEAAFRASSHTAETRAVIANIIKTIVDEALAGCRTRELWTHPQTGDIYALSSLDTDGVVALLRREIIKVEADRLRIAPDVAHDKLDRIIEKHRKITRKAEPVTQNR